MKREDSVYIRHIADAIDKIEKYTGVVDEKAKILAILQAMR